MNTVHAVKNLFIILVGLCMCACSGPDSMQSPTHPNNEERDSYQALKLASEAAVVDLIKASQSCNTDTDCVVENLGCPFGCSIGLNNKTRQSVVKAVDVHNEQYPQCVFRCKQTESVSCVANTCVSE